MAATPRHLFVPNWWTRNGRAWALRQGATDEQVWLDAAYADRSLITRVGPLHADDAKPGDSPMGRPTISATLPSLVVRMYRYGQIGDRDDVLDLGLGTGYGTCVAAHRLSDQQVTAVDVDPLACITGRERLAEAGRRPTVVCADATEELPGTFDVIVATVGLRRVYPSILDALNPGGRLVTTIAGTTLIITVEKAEDGTATGQVLWDRAGFMPTRSSLDYPPGADDLLDAAVMATSEHPRVSPYPVVDVANAWDLSSMLDLTAPDIAHHYEERGDGTRVAVMAHSDGSWARATGRPNERAAVDQGGPRRLWDILDELRTHWLTEGELPARGAQVFVKADGTTILARGNWHVKL
ncbi:methyltransferase domain-containing protein [Streptomyces sp. CBMA152]|uniref:methyltransferase domain-containing protein n=1 Tax=Streptomyces sp. CBMA152 TaxID=1896312 RepID=UPI002948B9C5|nr:methyltransferase domain-containing protein [Streptomyces sp. CBMA152]